MDSDYNKGAAPFFIVGCERSGTTLLQVLLDSHPNIAIPYESHIFHRFYNRMSVYGDLAEEDNNLLRFVTDVLNDVWIRRWGLTISPNDFCQTVTERSFAGCVRHLFSMYAITKGKLRWGDKTPVHVLYVKEIVQCFPDARIIHLIRDGRDVSESLKRVTFAPPTILGNSKRWRNRIDAFKAGRRYCDPLNVLEIHYEELVGNTQQAMEKILQFIGEETITFSSAVPESDLKKNYAQAGSSAQTLTGTIKTNKIGIFRTTLTLREIAIFEAVAGEQLKEYGYILETDGDAHITFFEKCYSFAKGGAYRVFYKYLRISFYAKSLWQLRWKALHYKINMLVKK